MTNPTEVEKLVERLRNESYYDGPEAANLIKAQAAEIARLRAALEHWNAQAAAWLGTREHYARPGWMQLALEKARAALAAITEPTDD